MELAFTIAIALVLAYFLIPVAMFVLVAIIGGIAQLFEPTDRRDR